MAERSAWRSLSLVGSLARIWWLNRQSEARIIIFSTFSARAIDLQFIVLYLARHFRPGARSNKIFMLLLLLFLPTCKASFEGILSLIMAGANCCCCSWNAWVAFLKWELLSRVGEKIIIQTVRHIEKKRAATRKTASQEAPFYQSATKKLREEKENSEKYRSTTRRIV